MRKLLVERDYGYVSTEDVLALAGVSRGALYHHFSGKLELFRAAYVESERDAMARIAAALPPDAGPLEQLRAGCRAYLAECAGSGEMQRIGLRQSRAVLGWESWRETAVGLGIGMMRATVQAAVEAGELSSADVEVTADLLMAALIEAGLMVASAEDPGAARRAVEPELMRLLDGLR
jgi:AcrR family transcriptional regulator